MSMSKYDIKCIEDEIISRLDKGEKVYIDSGAANVSITSYSIKKYKIYIKIGKKATESLAQWMNCLYSYYTLINDKLCKL